MIEKHVPVATAPAKGRDEKAKRIVDRYRLSTKGTMKMPFRTKEKMVVAVCAIVLTAVAAVPVGHTALSAEDKQDVSPQKNPAAPGRVPAFPGAEGFGKFTQGGRGGDVYIVTNLNDKGPGSLRDGVLTATGPRTIVFEVAGTIPLMSPLDINKKSHLTIAGQTAPGKGITLRDSPVCIEHSEHIVMRYLRVRLGDANKAARDWDVMSAGYSDHVILDHLSLSWGIDGNSDYRGNKNMTLQWLIYSEAMHKTKHSKGAHAMCTSLRDCQGNTTVHHNIYSTSRSRHPTLGSGSGAKGGANWILDFRNCVNYNWSGTTNLGGLQINVVNNYYRPGPLSSTSATPCHVKDTDTTQARGFARGNYFDGLAETFNQDNFTAIVYTNKGIYMSTTRERWELSKEIDCGEFTIPVQSAKDAYASCLKYAGCSLVRDTVDERSIANIVAQTGKLIDSQDQVGGWDAYPMQRRPEDWDRDRDGMPDTWEKAMGLNPDDANDRNGDRDGDGYTNLEEYLNSLCPDPVVRH